MSVSSAAIKKTAKDILKNNFIKSTVVTAIVMSVWFIIYNFAGLVQMFTNADAFLFVVLIFSFFLFLPLVIGFFRFFWRMISGVVDNPVCVFYYFSNRTLYLKALKFLFSITVRIAVCYFVLYIPVLVLELITGTWLYNTLDLAIPMWTFNLSAVSSILKVLAFIVTLFAVMKYYLSPMLFVTDENIDTAEAIHLSTVIAKRTKLDFFYLFFSFSGWLLLSFLSVPLLFTLPYFAVSYLLHSTYSVSDFNEQLSHISYDDIPTFIAGV